MGTTRSRAWRPACCPRPQRSSSPPRLSAGWRSAGWQPERPSRLLTDECNESAVPRPSRTALSSQSTWWSGAGIAGRLPRVFLMFPGASTGARPSLHERELVTRSPRLLTLAALALAASASVVGYAVTDTGRIGPAEHETGNG